NHEPVIRIGGMVREQQVERFELAPALGLAGVQCELVVRALELQARALAERAVLGTHDPEREHPSRCAGTRRIPQPPAPGAEDLPRIDRGVACAAAYGVEAPHGPAAAGEEVVLRLRARGGLERSARALRTACARRRWKARAKRARASGAAFGQAVAQAARAV